MAMGVLACRRRAPTLLHLVHGRVAILACAGDGWVDSKLGPLQSTVLDKATSGGAGSVKLGIRAH